MYQKFAASHANVVRILIAVGALAMFVVSAGAPHGLGG
jgi:hypothetical protein